MSESVCLKLTFDVVARVNICTCTSHHRVMEVVLIGLVTTVSFFILATLLGTCVPVLKNNSAQEFVNSTRDYFCPPTGTKLSFDYTSFTDYYNDLATLMFNSEEDSIKQLFHQNGQ